MNRLIPTNVLRDSTCLISIRITAYVVLFEFILSIMVLFTRAYAVWGGSKTILCLLGAAYAGVVAGGSFSVHLFMSGVNSHPIIRPATGCLVHISNDDLWIALTIMAIAESLALGLLLCKSLKHAGDVKHIAIFRSTKQDILAVMVRDGVAYFVCNLAITATNLLLLKKMNHDSQDILIIMQGALENILCARLLFHIRAVNDSPDSSLDSNRTTLPWVAVQFSKTVSIDVECAELHALGTPVAMDTKELQHWDNSIDEAF